MRPGQNRRVRGRSRSKGPNPLTRSYESNGPDVKVRGTAQHVADKYAQLARDAQSSGDPVAAENYYQHAEHYYRIIAGAQEQFRQQFGGYGQRPFDEDGEDGDEEAGPNGYPYQGGERPSRRRQRRERRISATSRSPTRAGRTTARSATRAAGTTARRLPTAAGTTVRRLSTAAGTTAPSASIAASGSGRIGAASATDAIATTAPEAVRPSATERYEQLRPPGQPPRRAERTGASGTTATDRGPRSEPGRSEPDPSASAEASKRRSAPRPRGRTARRRAGTGRATRASSRGDRSEPAGLPAFLTNPVRAPIRRRGCVASLPAPAEAAGETGGRRRRGGRTHPHPSRRRTRYKGPGEDGAPEGAAPAEDPTPAE